MCLPIVSTETSILIITSTATTAVAIITTTVLFCT